MAWIDYTGATWTANATYHPVTNLADRSATTDWSPGNTSGWFQVKLAAPATAYSYTLTAFKTYAAQYSPTTWTVKGSNDGTAWTVLDTKTAQPQFASAEARTYPIAAPASYLYYRVDPISVSTGQWEYLGGFDLNDSDGVPPPSGGGATTSFVGFGLPI